MQEHRNIENLEQQMKKEHKNEIQAALNSFLKEQKDEDIEQKIS